MKQPLIVIILLIQLFLRIHHTDALPGYADESLHIRRAEVAWDFYEPVASYQPGKLMLYYYLGIFETERIHALVISRLAVALMSLLGSVAIYALGKALHSERAGLVGMFFYAVIPYAIFFDRMALADPPAMVIFALAAWSLVNWAHRPTMKRSALSGILLLLTPFAKLTGAGIVFAPFLVIYLTPSPRWRGGRGVRSLTIIYAIFGIFWAILMIPTLLGEIRGGEHRMEIVDEYLLNAYEEDQSFVPNLIDNIGDAFRQIGIYFWPPVMILTVILGLALIFLRWRAALFLWGMLALAWLPTLAGSEIARTRYLTLGLPFLILLLVLGLFALVERIQPKRLIEWSIFAAVMVYGLAWGLPFFQNASTDPTALTLPERDRWRYMQAVTAGYGLQEAVTFLENDLAHEVGENPVEVVGILGSCHLMRLFLQEPGPVRLICADLVPVHQLTDSELAEIEADAADGPLYLLLERDLGTNLDDLNLEWEFVRDFERPHEGVTIELWRVSP